MRWLFFLVVFVMYFDANAEEAKEKAIAREIVMLSFQANDQFLTHVRDLLNAIEQYAKGPHGNDASVKIYETLVDEVIISSETYKKAVIDTLSGIYCSYFDLKELRKLKKLYSSKLGTKLWHVNSEIEAISPSLSKYYASMALSETLRKLEPYFKEQEIERVKDAMPL